MVEFFEEIDVNESVPDGREQDFMVVTVFLQLLQGQRLGLYGFADRPHC